MLIPFGVFSAAGASGGGGGAGSYELIESNILVSNASSVTFSSIPSTYKHLQIRMTLRADTNSSIADGLVVRFNGDTGSNYRRRHQLEGTGSSVTSSADAQGTNIIAGRTSGQTAGSNMFAANVTDILDYSSTQKYTTTRTLQGLVLGSFNRISLQSGLWMSTAAVNSINLQAEYGNLISGTRISLYGIKG